MPDTLDTNQDSNQQQDITKAELANTMQQLVETAQAAIEPIKALQSAVKDLSANFKSSSANWSSQLKQSLQSNEQLAKAIEQVGRKTQGAYSSHIHGYTNKSESTWKSQAEKATYDTSGYAKYTSNQDRLSTDLSGYSQKLTNAMSNSEEAFKKHTEAQKKFTNDLSSFMKSPKGWASRKWREGVAGVGARVFKSVGGGALGTVLGFGVGVLGNAIAKVVSSVINQAAQGFKDYFSWNVIGGNYANAFRTEAQLGNFIGGGRNNLTEADYSSYRSRMRLMGVRDDAQIAAAIQKLAGVGIAGGTNRADVVGGAVSRQAVKSMFGIDVSDAFMGSMYRSTGMSRPTALYEKGVFDVQKMFQRLAITVEKTANAFGGQTGLNELYGIVQTVSQRFRGLDNNMDQFVSGLGVYSKLIADNTITAEQAEGLLQASYRISTGKQFEMLAWEGVQGKDLLKEREQFVRRGVKATGSQENAQEFARSMLQFYNKVGGDEYQKMYFLRQKLTDFGYGDLATGVEDPKKLLERVAGGDKAATDELQNSMKSQRSLLEKQVQHLDAIQHPVLHIRDLMFGIMNNSTLGKKLKAGALNVAELGARMTGASDEDIANLKAKYDTSTWEGATNLANEMGNLRKSTEEATAVNKDLLRYRKTSSTLVIGESDS